MDRGRASARSDASGGRSMSDRAGAAAKLAPVSRTTAGGRPEWLPLAILAGIAAVVIVAAMQVTPHFLTVDNIRAILRNASIVGIVAVGMTPITLSGNFVSLSISQSAMLAMVSFVAMLG